jgi:hypothetical protein
MRLLALLTLTLLLAACGSGGFALGEWRDADGDRLPETTVYSAHGHEHCGTENVWVIGVGRDRLGGSEPGGELFLRDPDAALVEHLGPYRRPEEPFQPDADVPHDATDTGYRNGDAELWLAANHSAAYLIFEDRTERWPKTTYDHECD